MQWIPGHYGNEKHKLHIKLELKFYKKQIEGEFMEEWKNRLKNKPTGKHL